MTSRSSLSAPPHSSASPLLLRPGGSRGFELSSLLGECALVDRESGRVLWEGGSSSTLSASVGPRLNQLGFSHLRASALSWLIWLGLLGYLSRWVQRRISRGGSPVPWQSLPSWIPKQAHGAALILLQWTLFKAPVFNPALLALIMVLYLLEVYTCSTHRYLSNAVKGLDRVEAYVEGLRSEQPEIQWKVRCYHYESPWWLAPIRAVADVRRGMIRRGDPALDGSAGVGEESSALSASSASSWPNRRVVTHQASASYRYGRSLDRTVAGVWRPAPRPGWTPPPFTKLLLSLLLVLPDAPSRDDYLRRQGSFVTDHGQGDRYAEFSTGIHLRGFRRRMLAVRPDSRGLILRQRLAFWTCALLGLTVPYRLWFSDRCDEIRVTVVKEIVPEGSASALSADPLQKKDYRSWFMSTAPSTPRDDSRTFRSMMQGLRLYALKEASANISNHPDALQSEEPPR